MIRSLSHRAAADAVEMSQRVTTQQSAGRRRGSERLCEIIDEFDGVYVVRP